MSAAVRRVTLAQADRVATDVVSMLQPACERIQVAGSIRRRRTEIGDVEIVAVPRMLDGTAQELFEPSEKVSELEGRIGMLLQAGSLARHPDRPANGERYKRLWIPKPGIQLDLFIVLPPAEWGPMLAIRTGPADYSRMLVTRLHRYGLRCEDVRVVNERGAVFPCPEEIDFFHACRVPWAKPEDRR